MTYEADNRRLVAEHNILVVENNTLRQQLDAAVELLERNGIHRPDLFPALAAGRIYDRHAQALTGQKAASASPQLTGGE